VKTLAALVICLVLSLTLAGQVKALQSTLPIDGINNVLQMRIDQELLQGLINNFAIMIKGKSESDSHAVFT